jgi:hypothetical protein
MSQQLISSSVFAEMRSSSFDDIIVAERLRLKKSCQFASRLMIQVGDEKREASARHIPLLSYSFVTSQVSRQQVVWDVFRLTRLVATETVIVLCHEGGCMLNN